MEEMELRRVPPGREGDGSRESRDVVERDRLREEAGGGMRERRE